MAPLQLVALALILSAVAVLTAILVGVLRSPAPLVARHIANLALPFALAPLVIALFLAAGGAGAAILILLLQLVSGATESHMAGHVHWRREHRDGPSQPDAPDTVRDVNVARRSADDAETDGADGGST